jgi:hypothetical protein
VQKFINGEIEEPRSEKILALTQVLNDLSDGKKPPELPLLMKMHSNTDIDLDFMKSENVQFE